jgi:hypothetical protein
VFDDSVPVPAVITSGAVSEYVGSLISNGTVLDFRINDQLLYFVFTSGRLYSDPDYAGIHGSDQLNGQTFHFAWTQDPLTITASHEVIEACTDPEGNGFMPPENGIEVGDICEAEQYGLGLSDGIQAAPYWSNLNSLCVLPHRIATIVIADQSFSECRIGPSVGSQSTFAFSFGVYLSG